MFVIRYMAAGIKLTRLARPSCEDREDIYVPTPGLTPDIKNPEKSWADTVWGRDHRGDRDGGSELPVGYLNRRISQLE